MRATSLNSRPATVSSRKPRTRALAWRRADMSGAQFVLLATGWVAAAGGILAISLLVRSFG